MSGVYAYDSTKKTQQKAEKNENHEMMATYKIRILSNFDCSDGVNRYVHYLSAFTNNNKKGSFSSDFFSRTFHPFSCTYKPLANIAPFVRFLFV